MASKATIILSTLAASGMVVIVLITAFDLKITNADSVGRGSVDSRLIAQGGIESPRSDDIPRVVVQMPEPPGEFAGAGVSALANAAEKLATAKVYEQDSRTLDQKYDGATLGQLMAAKCLLEERRDSDRDRIGKELIAAGRLSEVIPNSAGQAAIIAGAKDGSPVSTIQTFDFVDGVSVVKAAVISGEEFPDYRALELEVWWLDCKIHTLKKKSASEQVMLK
ncbi:MAG: hypothetical protein IPK67_06480 [Planctomycetes bacterium]|nr:hypothetical protein [Planctomycetota bacterium]